VFDTSSSVIADNVKAQILLGMYESAEAKFVRRHLRGAKVVLDLGASLGITSSHALRVMDPSGHLVAVEPNSALQEPLAQMLRRNSRGQRTSVVHAAIGPKAEESVRLDTSGLTVASRIASEGEVVPVTSLEEVLQDFGYIDTPYALVADIEGAEQHLLREDRAALANCTAAVFEFHTSAGRAIPDLAELVSEAGFEEVEAHGPVVAFRRAIDIRHSPTAAAPAFGS